MDNKKYTIDDLLHALQNPTKASLENSREVWSRIGSKDSFPELGLEPSKLELFLKEFVESNPYSNL
jgi:hypothetical protein